MGLIIGKGEFPAAACAVPTARASPRLPELLGVIFRGAGCCLAHCSAALVSLSPH